MSKIAEHHHRIGNNPEEKTRIITKLVNRPIKWGLVKMAEKEGKLLKCEVCGNEGYGGFWCKPCIHYTWCCECCILLGIPNYYTAIFVIEATSR